MDARDRSLTCGQTRTIFGAAVRELDHRCSDGIEVWLLWDPDSDGIAVAVAHDRSGESFVFPVDGAEALSAFRQPFAYAETHSRLASHR
jgi:hypothetical protein